MKLLMVFEEYKYSSSTKILALTHQQVVGEKENKLSNCEMCYIVIL